MSEKGDGRDHNPTGFTMWMAGGGVRGGQTIGATDDLGLYAVEDRAHVHDIHASILHLMGLDRLHQSQRIQIRWGVPTDYLLRPFYGRGAPIRMRFCYEA